MRRVEVRKFADVRKFAFGNARGASDSHRARKVKELEEVLCSLFSFFVFRFLLRVFLGFPVGTFYFGANFKRLFLHVLV